MSLLLASIHKRVLIYLVKKEISSQNLKKDGTITLKMDEAIYFMILLHDGSTSIGLAGYDLFKLQILLGKIDKEIKSHPDFINIKRNFKENNSF